MTRNESIMPLIIHPVPGDHDTILNWIKKLAGLNNMPLGMLLGYVKHYARKQGFFQALHLLTRYPVENIEKMENEFKDMFWKNSMQCPLKNCTYTAKKRSILTRHLNMIHGI